VSIIYQSGISTALGAFWELGGTMTMEKTQDQPISSNAGGTTWSQVAKLTATDGAADDRFGFSVSIMN
jgi:hypothetical protein